MTEIPQNFQEWKKRDKLGDWFSLEGVDFVLRQKKDAFIAENLGMHKSLEELEIRPGMKRDLQPINPTCVHPRLLEGQQSTNSQK